MNTHPGLVVMGGDSRSKGREFESWHRILDGHFFTYLFVVRFVMCDGKDEKNEKESGVGTFFIKKVNYDDSKLAKPISVTMTLLELLQTTIELL